ncbi:MAG: hypothetical protein JWQ35_1510, partial [Bacteriovoracaceae bacterium]|nr:hypothetical protein [Bacteriovoracaceae bacterium]
TKEILLKPLDRRLIQSVPKFNAEITGLNAMHLQKFPVREAKRLENAKARFDQATQSWQQGLPHELNLLPRNEMQKFRKFLEGKVVAYVGKDRTGSPRNYTEYNWSQVAKVLWASNSKDEFGHLILRLALAEIGKTKRQTQVFEENLKTGVDFRIADKLPRNLKGFLTTPALIPSEIQTINLIEEMGIQKNITSKEFARVSRTGLLSEAENYAIEAQLQLQSILQQKQMTVTDLNLLDFIYEKIPSGLMALFKIFPNSDWAALQNADHVQLKVGKFIGMTGNYDSSSPRSRPNLTVWLLTKNGLEPFNFSRANYRSTVLFIH